MFDIFKNKKVGELSSKVEALEQGLTSLKDTCGLGVEVVGLQEQIILNLQEQLSTTQSRLAKTKKANNSLLRKLKRAEKKPVSTVISKKGINPASQTAPKSRAEKIKLAEKRVKPLPTTKSVEVLGELTPRSVKFKGLSVEDRAAILSDVLGVKVVAGKGRVLLIDGINMPIRLLTERDGGYLVTHLKDGGYVLFPDPITNKFLLSYVSKDNLTKSKCYYFTSTSDRANTIRSNHNKVLSVLKDKVGA